MPALFCLSQELAFPPSNVGSMSEGGVLIRPLFIWEGVEWEGRGRERAKKRAREEAEKERRCGEKRESEKESRKERGSQVKWRNATYTTARLILLAS